MDAEALKIILELQRENTLYKRAISDILFILLSKKFLAIPECNLDDGSLHCIFRKLKELYGSDKSAQEQPTTEERAIESYSSKRTLDLILTLLKNPNTNPAHINDYMIDIANLLKASDEAKQGLWNKPSRETEEELAVALSTVGVYP